MERVGGSEREPCVVRNRRERRGRTLKFQRRPGERSQPGRQIHHGAASLLLAHGSP
jgi:hypothetical protein